MYDGGGGIGGVLAVTVLVAPGETRTNDGTEPEWAYEGTVGLKIDVEEGGGGVEVKEVLVPEYRSDPLVCATAPCGGGAAAGNRGGAGAVMVRG